MGDLGMGIEWTRPLGALALLIPAAVWVLARRRARPAPLAIGTFELWRAAPATTARERPRSRPPLELLLLLLALGLGAVALAGPRRVALERAPEWRVIVDRSPSMYLEHQAGGTRLEVALARLESAAAEAGASLASWHAPGPGLDGEHPQLPADWTSAPRHTRPEPRWERFDEPGTIWLTDSAPQLEPTFAGLVASGGEARPITVASRGSTALEWDGRELVERPGALAPPRARIEPGVPEVVASLVRAWAAERGVTLSEAASGSGEEALTILAAPAGQEWTAELLVGHEGWTAAARIVDLAPADAETWTWLSARTGGRDRPLVRARPGVIELACVELGDPRGDPTFFAISWSALLDRVVAPAPGIAPIGEYGSAEPSEVRSPRAGELLASDRGDSEREPFRGETPERPLVFWLTAAAAGCAACALLLRAA